MNSRGEYSNDLLLETLLPRSKLERLERRLTAGSLALNDVSIEHAGDVVCEVRELVQNRSNANPLSQNEETSSTMITEDSNNAILNGDMANGDMNPAVPQPLPNKNNEHQAADGGHSLDATGGRTRERKRRKVAPSAPGGGKMPSHPTSMSPPAAPTEALPAQTRVLGSLKGHGHAPLPPGTHTTGPVQAKGGGQKKLSSYFPTLDQSSKDGLEAPPPPSHQQQQQIVGAGPQSSSLPQPPCPRTSTDNPNHPSVVNQGSGKELSLKLNQLNEQLQSKDQIISNLNDQLQSKSEHLKILEAKSTSWCQEIESLRGENERLRAQIEEMRVGVEVEKKGAMERETRLKNELSRSLRSSARLEFNLYSSHLLYPFP